MPRRKNTEKGVVLFIVLGTLFIVVILSGVILRTITSQSTFTHHQVSRIKAYYAGKGIMNYSLDQLRKGTWVPGGGNRYACLGDCSGFGVATPDYVIPADAELAYNILVTIYPLNRADNASLDTKVTQLNIKTDYTYIE